jgi:membrane-bound lytic murein transglycosylase A
MKQKMPRRYIAAFFICVIFTCLAGGCAVPGKPPPVVPKPEIVKITPFDYPEFYDDMAYDGLEHAVLQSIAYLNKIPSDREFRFGNDTFNASHMVRSMSHFLNFIQTKPTKKSLKKFLKTNYLVYRSIGHDQKGKVLFTGYYEPHLRGTLKKNTEYRYPVYTRPSDLASIDLSPFSSKFKGEKIIGRYANSTFIPYFDRGEIERKSAIENRAEKIAWLRDPVDLFFLQVQGSGRIYLDNGTSINVHYHATNGRPYRSIGKLLIEEEKIARSQMSMQAIRAYLREHPEEVEAILDYNPSYVFFKIEKDGPLGYLEVKLTPGRSVALDRRIFPLSALAFIKTKKPVLDGDGNIHNWTDLKRFVLNQDTGGAIQGPGRADLFWGNGTSAAIAAGHMKPPGTLYFLILKPDA